MSETTHSTHSSAPSLLASSIGVLAGIGLENRLGDPATIGSNDLHSVAGLGLGMAISALPLCGIGLMANRTGLMQWAAYLAMAGFAMSVSATATDWVAYRGPAS